MQRLGADWRLVLAFAGVVACGGGSGDDDGDDTSVGQATYDTQPLDSGPAFETDRPSDTDDTDFVPDTDTGGVDTDTDVDTDLLLCPPGWVRDCGGNCSSELILGDGFCDEGPGTKPDFNCDSFDFDDGDCVLPTFDTSAGPCPFPGELPDCEGVCFGEGRLGDGVCDNGPTPNNANFDCPQYDRDRGDCGEGPVDTGIDTDAIPTPCPSELDVRDCRGRCYDAGWVGDDRCDDGTLFPYGRPDFLCPLHDFDAGDCADTGAPDDTAPTSDTAIVVPTTLDSVDTLATASTADTLTTGSTADTLTTGSTADTTPTAADTTPTAADTTPTAADTDVP